MYVDRRLEVIAVLLFLVTSLMLVVTVGQVVQQKELGGISPKQYLEMAIQEDYTAYLDGEQIDITTVDPSDYMITVDNKNDKIYLSQPRFLDPKGMIKVKN